MAALLEVRGLVKSFGRRKVVDGVNFEVHPGEIVGLLGPNGAGKTTSFRMTAGQLTPNDGRVCFTGVDVTGWPMYKRARLGLGYLPQEQSIFRRLTVEQNLLAILEALPKSRSLGRPLTRKERWERTEAALERFRLTHVRKTNSARASGGEKRRLEIARCLVCEPLLIMLDEPFANVDPLTKNDIQQIVRSLAASGIGILITDHDVDHVLEVADRIYLITDGKVRTHGTPGEIVRDPAAINSYLGQKYWNREFGPARHPAPAPIAPASPPTPEADPEVQRWIAELMGDAAQFRRAVSHLLPNASRSAPALLAAMEQPATEVRRRAYAVLRQMTGGRALFDPFAPLPARQQQLATLREQLLQAQR
ncbi:MAG TPA: LPS export ABC transporter ATP-binding protein [Gemmataceae bacterium]|jgi:lipopolysaccharide export system ATP-binding protein|nr:LPS export ABC transporter ATP-binding protein [Gemmataceae bacterium]